jgi:hypothetical protein
MTFLFVKEEKNMKRDKIKLLFEAPVEKDVYICAWLRTNRVQAQFGF